MNAPVVVIASASRSGRMAGAAAAAAQPAVARPIDVTPEQKAQDRKDKAAKKRAADAELREEKKRTKIERDAQSSARTTTGTTDGGTVSDTDTTSSGSFRQCRFCGESMHSVNRESNFCPSQECKLNNSEPIDSPANLHIGQRVAATIAHSRNIELGAAGLSRSVLLLGQQTSHANTAASSSSNRVTLTHREQLIASATALGSPNLKYGNTAAMTATQALAVTGKAFASSTYVPLSATIIEHIQSGKMDQMGLALRQLLPSTSASLAAAAGQTVLTSDEHGITRLSVAPSTLNSIRIQSMDDFSSALFHSILPSLIGRPEAMADWLSFACTIIELNKKSTWPVAEKYLTRVLATRVHARLDLGTVDSAILQEVMHEVAMERITQLASYSRSPAPTASSSSAQQQYSAAPSAAAASAPPTKCHNFNEFGLAGCRFKEKCSFAHECSYPGCVMTPHHAALECIRHTTNGEPIPPRVHYTSTHRGTTPNGRGGGSSSRGRGGRPRS